MKDLDEVTGSRWRVVFLGMLPVLVGYVLIYIAAAYPSVFHLGNHAGQSPLVRILYCAGEAVLLLLPVGVPFAFLLRRVFGWLYSRSKGLKPPVAYLQAIVAGLVVGGLLALPAMLVFGWWLSFARNLPLALSLTGAVACLLSVGRHLRSGAGFRTIEWALVLVLVGGALWLVYLR